MTRSANDCFAVVLGSLAEGDEASFQPKRLVEPASWLGHAPFARWLARAAAPRLVVELGVHSGNSYCALVQSVAELGLKTTCLGVDTWKGDAQAGIYDESVLDDLKAHHDPLYGGFSRLVRSTFELALPLVEDRSVDILHIDGCHAYDAVRRDFETWRPKLSARGVVLLHDICEIQEGFGVDRLWQELRAAHAGFAFAHSHGLGVLLAGEAPPPTLAALAALDRAPQGDSVRAHFARLGQSLVQAVSLKSLERRRDKLTLDLDRERARNADLDRALDQANRRFEDLNREHEKARERLASQQADLVRLGRELAESDLQERSLRQQLGESSGRIRALLAERRERARALGDAQALERTLRARTNALQGDLEQARLQGTQRLEALHRAQASLRETRAEVARLGFQAEAFRNSLSWRVTAPLRRLGRGLRSPARRAELEREAQAIAKSGLFDQAFYLEANPDVAASGQDPALHYVAHGWREGRQPSPVFDQTFYLDRHPEVRDSGLSPLSHYLAHDKSPGHDPNPFFDTAFYLRHNPDVTEADVNPLAHYLNHGAAEGRDPHEDFITRFALMSNPELARSGENPLAWRPRHGQGRPGALTLDRLAELCRPAPSALDWGRRMGPHLRPRIAFAVFLDARGRRFSQAMEAAATVLGQTYPFWRLSLLLGPDDSTAMPEALAQDPRVEPLRETASERAAADALDRAVRDARTDLDPDDALRVAPWAVCLSATRRLEPHALFELARAAATRPGLALMATDDMEQDPDGHLTPRLKYGLPTLPGALTAPVDECLAVSGQALTNSRACPWLTGPGGARDMLGRLNLAENQAASLPLFLSRSVDTARADHDIAAPARADEGDSALPESAFDLASVVIPTAGRDMEANLAPCLASLAARRAGMAFEIVLVDNSPEGLPRETLDRLAPSGVRVEVVRDAGPFNFPRLVNAGVRASRGSLVTLLNDDVELVGDDWLAALARLASIQGCAVAGAKLLYPDRSVQHAGMFHDRRGFLHAFRHAPNDSARNPLLGQARRVSAVTFACAAIPRAVWDRLGGLDPEYAVECNDTDFCLRAARAGFFSAWTPDAALIHKESASRRGIPASGDRARLREYWADVLDKPDPYHHRLLSPLASLPRPTDAPVLTERHAPSFTAEDASALGLDALPGAPEPETILAMDLGHLGDLVLALPALTALRRSFPRARLTLACSPANLGLAHRLCDVDDVVAQPLFHAKSENGLLPGHGPDHAPSLSQGLAGRRFDLAVDLRRHGESRPLLGLIDATLRAGYETGAEGPALDIRLPLIDRVSDQAGNENSLHAAAQKFALALASVSPEKRPDLIIDDYLPTLVSRLDRNLALTRFGLPEGRFLAGLHPGSGSSLRRWPAEAWAELADRLVREKNALVLLLGAPDEAELAGQVLALCSRRESVVNLAGELPLDDFCDLAPHLDAFVGNNSGPCHLAGIAGVATVTPWSGQVSAQEWLAMGPRTLCVRAAVPCAPCYCALPKHCLFDRFCLRQVDPSSVFDALESLLAFENPPKPEPAREPDLLKDFDPEAYLAANPDVAASGVDPQAHYRLHGLAEGRPLRPALGPDTGGPVPTPNGDRAGEPTAEAADAPFTEPKSFADSLGELAKKPLICVISHDASRTGAPLIALQILKRLAKKPGVNACALLLGAGELAGAFARAAPTLVLPGAWERRDMRRLLSAAFAAARPGLCLANTVASARCALALCDLGLPVMSLAHEMPATIESLTTREDFCELARRSRPLVLPSEAAASAIASRFGLDRRDFPVALSGSFRAQASPETAARNRRRIRRELALGDTDFLTLGCASLNLRKGADLFARLAALCRSARPMRFVWVGDDSSPLAEWLKHDALAQGLSDRLRFVGAVDDPGPYLHAADALALTSREDPFPLIVLEAMQAGLPVVAFAGAGGAPEALADCGLVAPVLDVAVMADALVRLADDPALAASLGQRGARRAADLFVFDRYMADLAGLMAERHGIDLDREPPLARRP